MSRMWSRACFARKDKASGKAYADGAGMFISYSAMRHITGGEENTDPGISCYELVMAEPITGFGLSVLRESFPMKDVSVFVQNTNRYSLKSLLTVVSQFGERSMNTAGVIFPYWENAARYTEDHAALDFVLLVLFSLCPIVSLIILIIREIRSGWRYLSTKIRPRSKRASRRKRKSTT